MIMAWAAFVIMLAWTIMAHFIRHGELPVDLSGFRITHRSDNWQLLLFLYAVATALSFLVATLITIKGVIA